MSLATDAAKLARDYARAGYRVERGGHYKVRDQEGRLIVTFACTPGTQNGIRLARREYAQILDGTWAPRLRLGQKIDVPVADHPAEIAAPEPVVVPPNEPVAVAGPVAGPWVLETDFHNMAGGMRFRATPSKDARKLALVCKSVGVELRELGSYGITSLELLWGGDKVTVSWRDRDFRRNILPRVGAGSHYRASDIVRNGTMILHPLGPVMASALADNEPLMICPGWPDEDENRAVLALHRDGVPASEIYQALIA